MADHIGKTVQAHALNLYHYLHGVIYERVDKIADSNMSLHDIDEPHCGALAEFFQDL